MQYNLGLSSNMLTAKCKMQNLTHVYNFYIELKGYKRLSLLYHGASNIVSNFHLQ